MTAEWSEVGHGISRLMRWVYGPDVGRPTRMPPATGRRSARSVSARRRANRSISRGRHPSRRPIPGAPSRCRSRRRRCWRGPRTVRRPAGPSTTSSASWMATLWPRDGHHPFDRLGAVLRAAETSRSSSHRDRPSIMQPGDQHDVAGADGRRHAVRRHGHDVQRTAGTTTTRQGDGNRRGRVSAGAPDRRRSGRVVGYRPDRPRSGRSRRRRRPSGRR